MSDPFIAQIVAFPYTFAPRNYAFCQGQSISISQNSALFSLVGTMYGGDGRSSFKLPDFRESVALHSGTGMGLSTRRLGQSGGELTHTLLPHEMPQHSHDLDIEFGPNRDSPNITNRYLTSQTPFYEASPTSGTFLGSVGTSGQSESKGGMQPHENQMPYLALNYCISLFGAYPSRS